MNFFNPVGQTGYEREHGFLFPFALSSRQHLVNCCGWLQAFEYVKVGCKERGWPPHHHLTVHFRDVYFSRIYQRRVDFDRLWEKVSPFTKVQYRPATLGNPLLGRQLTFCSGFGRVGLVLYEDGQETVFSLQAASATDLPVILEGRFANLPVMWQTSVAEFVEFLQAVADCLNSPGKTLQSRLNLDVLGDGFLIRARGVYRPAMSPILSELLPAFGRQGMQILTAERKGLSNYAKIWFGDVAALKQQIMSRQDALVRGL